MADRQNGEPTGNEKELLPGLQAIDVFDGDNPSIGKSVTWDFCPDVKTEKGVKNIILFAVDTYTELGHESVYSFGAEHDPSIIPENYNTDRMIGGRIDRARTKNTPSDTYKGEI